MGITAESKNDSLTVRDNRTGKSYEIPCVSLLIFSCDELCSHTGRPSYGICRIVDNTVSATAFKAISAPRKPGEREENETEKGLRVADKGFLNTAVIQSQITYIDGDAGGAFVFCHYVKGSV